MKGRNTLNQDSSKGDTLFSRVAVDRTPWIRRFRSVAVLTEETLLVRIVFYRGGVPWTRSCRSTVGIATLYVRERRHTGSSNESNLSNPGRSVSQLTATGRCSHNDQRYYYIQDITCIGERQNHRQCTTRSVSPECEFEPVESISAWRRHGHRSRAGSFTSAVVTVPYGLYWWLYVRTDIRYPGETNYFSCYSQQY